jgi:hypothetical protein
VTYADRTGPSRVALVLRSKAMQILVEKIHGGPRVAEFTLYELLELANTIDPQHRMGVAEALAAARRTVRDRPGARL